MHMLRKAPLALLTIAMIGCTPAAPVDNPNNEQDNPNMPYEGDQDPEAFFDGTWNATIRPMVTEMPNGTKCGGATAVLTADNGALTGTAKTEWGYDLEVAGAVMPDGIVEGGLLKDGVDAGTFKGTMDGDSGEGTWADAFGCEGTFSMLKA